jgi:RHS repeat-associated protein
MKSARVLIVSFLMMILAIPALSQVATGTYPYGTYDKPGLDTINVGSLNVHFAIPILNKTGRGIPFTYNLSYDSSIWTPASVSGAMRWQPVGGLGWNAQTAAMSGYVTASYSTNRSGSGSCSTTTERWTQYVFHDPIGKAHPFNGMTSISLTFCNNRETSTNSGPLIATATDGSGYSINTGGAGTSNWTITSAVGTVINGPYNTQTGLGTYTDPNGNQITANSSGQFIDTTGKVALTLAGSGQDSNTLTYTNTKGNPQTVTIFYTTYTVQTAFGCSSIGEYGPTATSLISSIQFPDGSVYNFSYEPTPGVSGNVTGRLAAVQLPQGNTISYAYSGGNEGIECADGSTAGLTRTMNSDSGSAASTLSYTRTSPNGAGTSHTEAVDGLGNHKAYDFVESSNQPSGVTAAYYETNRKVYQGAESGTAVVARNTCYDGAASPCTSTFPSLPFSQIDTYETLNGLETHGTTTFYNAYGAQTAAEVWDFASETTSRGGLLRKEVWTYGYTIPNLPTADAVYDGSGNLNLSGETLYTYDGTTPTASSGVPQHVSVTGARGNLTSMTQYANATTSYTSSATYEDTGSVLTSTTPTGTTTYTYDPTFVYQTGVSLPTPSSGVALNASESFDTTYTGLPLAATDPNAQVSTVSSYDLMLRPTEITLPDGGQTTWTYTPTTVTTNTLQTPNPTAVSEAQLDGYGRPSRTEVANSTSGNSFYQQDTCYDANGNASFNSYRYQGTGFSSSKVCSGTGGDTYTYDVLGRLTNVARGNGETRSYSYSGRATEIVDENGVTRISQVDGLGRPTIVCEVSSASLQGVSPVSCGTDIAGTGFVTAYAYALATPTTTVTQGAQTRTFQTDWLGRNILTQEPESGQTTYSYAYNSTGLVATRIRPQANQPSSSVTTTTTTQYDALNRVLTVNYTDGTPAKTFAYDQSAGWGGSYSQLNLKGRLSAASVSNAVAIYGYDPIGRTALLGECTPSTCGASAYALNYTYDLAGNMLTSTDGAGVSSTYAVSVAQELQSLTSSLNNSTNPANILSSVQSGPNGPVNFGLGNGLSGVYGYDTLGRLNGGWVCSGSTSASCSGGAQVYGFTNGLKGVQLQNSYDSVLGQTSTYGYDGFNRLASRTVTSGTVQNFAWVYDRYGNRVQQNVTAGSGPQPQYSVNQANNQLSGFTYDAAGNMTNDGNHSYTYDAEGNITAVDGGSTASYVYNALNQRVRTVVGGTATEFVFNAAGQRVSEWNGTTHAQLKGHYYWGSKSVAFYASGATHFQHQDWLCTERMRTTYNGGVEGSFTSLPFGDGQSTAGSDLDANHYAALDLDYESGTEHAQFRQESSAQGRWLSPDPYSGSYDVSNPQSFNRYAYVGNNPLGFVDPTGLMICANTLCHYNGGGSGGGGNPLDPGSVPSFGPGDGNDGSLDALNKSESGTLTNSVWELTTVVSYSTVALSGDNDNPNLTGSGTVTTSESLVSLTETYISPYVNDFAWYLNSPASAAPFEMAQNNGPGSLSTAPNNNNLFKRWPLNGNITPATYQQDQKCSAGPVIGPAMDSLPGVLAACQWHDNKYIEYNCNATSWISPFPGPCKAINYMLLIKIYNALPIPIESF